MSIRKRTDRKGQWEVQWREGGRQRARLFARRKDAEQFELDIKRRRQLGPLAATVIQSRMTLAEFMLEEWWPRYAIPNLKTSTRRRYLEVWGAYLLPNLGGYQLREITPMLVEDLAASLAARGIAPASQRKALLLLSGGLRRAVVRGLIPHNPQVAVRTDEHLWSYILGEKKRRPKHRPPQRRSAARPREDGQPLANDRTGEYLLLAGVRGSMKDERAMQEYFA